MDVGLPCMHGNCVSGVCVCPQVPWVPVWSGGHQIRGRELSASSSIFASVSGLTAL